MDSSANTSFASVGAIKSRGPTSPRSPPTVSASYDGSVNGVYSTPLPEVQHSSNANVNPIGVSANLQFEEQLASEIRRYRYLYDSRAYEYRDRLARYSAWSDIIRKLGIVSVEAGEQLFTNLRKRYSKKRQEMKRAVKFGSREDGEKATAEFEKYKFFSWIEEHMKARPSKLEDPLKYTSKAENPGKSLAKKEVTSKYSSPSFGSQAQSIVEGIEVHILPASTPVSVERSDDHDPDSPDMAFSDSQLQPSSSDNGVATPPGSDDSSLKDLRAPPILEGYRSSIRDCLVPCSPAHRQLSQRRSTDSQWSAQHRPSMAQLPVDVVSTKHESWASSRGFQNVSQGRTQPSVAALQDFDDDELFGTMVTLELKKLGKRDKCLLKREINEAVFRAQLRVLDSSEAIGISVSSSGPCDAMSNTKDSRQLLDGSNSLPTRLASKRSK